MKIIYNQKEIECSVGKKVIDIFEDEIKNSKNNIIACNINNQIRDLNEELEDGDKVELVDLTKKDGRLVYQRGVMYIMSKAFNELYPDICLTVNYQLGDAMYCVSDNTEITEEIINDVHKKMDEIIKNKLEIRKVTMTKEVARDFYKKEKTSKGILQLTKKNKISLYFCEEYYNYFYGVMPINTEFIKIYDIMLYAKGFLVRYPSKKNINGLDEFVERKKLLSTLDEYENIHRLLQIETIEKLNKHIKDGSIKDVILLAEALHEKKMAEIANHVKEHPKLKMVLIAGPSSSGKTTFAKRLGIQLRLNGLKPVTISMDNYFVEREDNPKDENGEYDFECIEAIDTKLLNKDLTALLNGETIKVPTFNFKSGKKEYNGETMALKDDEILVIEGIHCLNDKLTFHIPNEQKFKIYVSDLTVLNIDYYNRISTTDTRLIRRIVRDYKFRGNGALRTLETWKMVNRGEEKNIYPFQEEADIMFNSSLIYELSVLKKYAKPLLEGIKEEEPEYSEAKRIIDLLQYFDEFDDELIPDNSILREFIGNSIFDY